jgi:regulation of enolase protein 1 (concanavalin A-like superfamily)
MRRMYTFETLIPWFRTLILVIAANALHAGALAAPQAKPHRAPLYWSPYEYCFTTDGYIPEDEWSANIDWVDKNLKKYGYKMVCIDGWGDDGRFNEYGYRTTHSSQWKHDYAWWAANLKARGMELGIYNNPLWIIKTAADAGVNIKGTDIPLKSILNEGENATWFKWVQVDRPGAEEYVKGYIRHYADMGVKYLRVDFLSWFEDGHDRNMGRVGPNRPREHYETALRWMREACDESGMFLSLVMPHLKNEAELEAKNGHMVRINDDTGEGGWAKFNDSRRGVRLPDWSQYANPMDGIVYWSRLSGRGKLILDSDFLRLNTFANDEERKTAVSACLVSGGPVTVADQYNTIGDSLWIYQNEEMLALNRDGFVGKPLSNDPTKEASQTWTGAMSNGDRIVAFFNRENTSRFRRVNFASLGFPKGAYVRDLWRRDNLGFMKSFQASVLPHGCVVIRISKNKPTVAGAPQFGKPAGLYTTTQTVTLISRAKGATIHYTLNGTTPTVKSPVYRLPLKISQPTTLKAFCRVKGMKDSPVVSARYEIRPTGPLPSPWENAVVGNAAPAGTTSFSNGSFVVTGSGADIEGTSDSFRFVHQVITGDATITAKIDSVSNTHPWAKAGLMFRDLLDADSRHAFIAVTPSSGVIFQRREKTETASTVEQRVKVPVWLRLTRKGSTFTAFRSADGKAWEQVGTPVDVPMAADALVGLAFTSHNNGTLGTAVFRGIAVSGSS